MVSLRTGNDYMYVSQKESDGWVGNSMTEDSTCTTISFTKQNATYVYINWTYQPHIITSNNFIFIIFSKGPGLGDGV